MVFFPLLFVVGLLGLFVNALHNITINVDDGIVYSGAWQWTSTGNIEFFGTQLMVSQDPNAIASFTFTGVAMYYTIPASSLVLDIVLTLDGQLLDTLHTLAQAQDVPDVIWSTNGLENKSHIFEISMASDGNNVVLERLIYTELDDIDIPSSTPTTTTSSVESLTSAPSSGTTGFTPPIISKGHRHTIRIALGTALGVVGLMLIAGIAWFFIKRKQKGPVSDASWTVDGSTPPPSLHYSAAADDSLPPIMTSTTTPESGATLLSCLRRTTPCTE